MASRRSSRSTTWTAPNGTPRRSVRQKRERAGVLVRRLKKQFAPGGVLHFGQGKWYPGESLPRWALGCWWRRDGVPVWNDDCLLADDTVDYGHGEEHAKRFVNELADRLEVDPSLALPAYEDTWYYMWRERRLPTNVDPLRVAADRRRGARAACPHLRAGTRSHRRIRAAAATRWTSNPGWHWESGRWFLRPEHLFLIPGDSPIGYRLPLDSLPWVTEDGLPLHLRAGSPRRTSAVATRGRCRVERDVRRAARYRGVGRCRHRSRGRCRHNVACPIPSVIRTALCVEPRDGRLHVFMPPVERTEDYLDLLRQSRAPPRR